VPDALSASTENADNPRQFRIHPEFRDPANRNSIQTAAATMRRWFEASLTTCAKALQPHFN
jgi:hypothetical protein